MPDKEVVAFGPFKSFIADGVRVADTIHLSGAVSVDALGNALHEGDVVAQLRQAYANIATVLEKFGASMDDIAYETLYVTDIGAIMADEELTNAFFGARTKAYGGTPQVAQCFIGIHGLVMPELLVEIHAIAHV